MIEVSDELAERMEKHPEINWTNMFNEYLKKQIDIIEAYAFLDKIEPVTR